MGNKKRNNYISNQIFSSIRFEDGAAGNEFKHFLSPSSVWRHWEEPWTISKGICWDELLSLKGKLGKKKIWLNVFIGPKLD